MFKVTNNNSFDLNDRYNGVDYCIPAGKSIALGDEETRHFFGIGESDKLPYLTRQGWMRNSLEREAAMEKLNNFVFDVVDGLNSGELIEDEQGSAPLQSESVAETVPDGAAETTDSTYEVPVIGKASGKSILDTLGGE